MASDRISYTYCDMGGKPGKRELPQQAIQAITGWLAATGRTLETMAPDASLWPDTRTGRGITSGPFYTNLRRYLTQAGLPPDGVHIFRHSGEAQARHRRVG